MFDAMTLTQTLAAFIGLYFVSAGIGLMRDRAVVATMFDGLKNNTLLGYLAGVIAFVIGAVMVTLHNDWSTWLSSFVSLVGWVALLEGVLMLSVREQFIGMFEGLLTSDGLLKAMSVATVAGGALLLWCALA